MTSTSPDPRNSAVLYDGVSAARHAVTVAVDTTYLTLAPADEQVAGPDCPLRWPWTGVHVLDSRPDGQVFSTDRAPDARLIVADAAIAATIQAHAIGDSPAGHGSHFWARHRRSIIAIGATAAVFLLLALLVKPITEGVAALLPEDTGAAMADQAIQAIAAEHRLCSGAAGLKALRSLTNRLTDAAGIAPPVLAVLDLGMVNAGALPGRRIVMMRGLIDEAESAAEVSAALAHELAHVVHRDPLTSWIRSDLINLLASAVFGTSVFGDAGQAVTAFLLDASYTRGQEARADETAIMLLRRTGITADGGAQFFRRLAKGQGVPTSLEPVLGLLKTHPGSAERADRFAAVDTGMDNGLTETEWAAVRTVCGAPGTP